MKILKFVDNVLTALLFSIVVTGAGYALGFAAALEGWSVLKLAAPLFFMELLIVFCRDSIKATDEDRVKEINIALDDGAIMPTRAHETDAGYDLYLPDDIVVGNNDKYFFIDTGVHIEIPKGYYGTIKARSGLNKNKHMTCQGVIDSGYTGTIGVKMYINERHTMEIIERGTRIAQLIIVPIVTPELKLVDELQETDRGNGGFGSTGEK